MSTEQWSFAAGCIYMGAYFTLPKHQRNKDNVELITNNDFDFKEYCKKYKNKFIITNFSAS